MLLGTAGGSSAENIAAWFQNPDAQVASHYVIGQDGTVVQCVDESDGAWANGRIESGADSCKIPRNHDKIYYELF